MREWWDRNREWLGRWYGGCLTAEDEEAWRNDWNRLGASLPAFWRRRRRSIIVGVVAVLALMMICSNWYGNSCDRFLGRLEDDIWKQAALIQWHNFRDQSADLTDTEKRCYRTDSRVADFIRATWPTTAAPFSVYHRRPTQGEEPNRVAESAVADAGSHNPYHGQNRAGGLRTRCWPTSRTLQPCRSSSRSRRGGRRANSSPRPRPRPRPRNNNTGNRRTGRKRDGRTSRSRGRSSFPSLSPPTKLDEIKNFHLEVRSGSVTKPLGRIDAKRELTGLVISQGSGRRRLPARVSRRTPLEAPSPPLPRRVLWPAQVTSRRPPLRAGAPLWPASLP